MIRHIKQMHGLRGQFFSRQTRFLSIRFFIFIVMSNWGWCKMGKNRWTTNLHRTGFQDLCGKFTESNLIAENFMHWDDFGVYSIGCLIQSLIYICDRFFCTKQHSFYFVFSLGVDWSLLRLYFKDVYIDLYCLFGQWTNELNIFLLEVMCWTIHARRTRAGAAGVGGAHNVRAARSILLYVSLCKSSLSLSASLSIWRSHTIYLMCMGEHRCTWFGQFWISFLLSRIV